MEDIKNCPFCGEKAVLRMDTYGNRGSGTICNNYSVVCCGCSAETKRYESEITQDRKGEIIVQKDGAKDAIAAWNRRTEDGEDTIRRQEVLDEMRKVYFSKEWLEYRVNQGSNGVRDYLLNFIENLHPAQSAQKTGKWIVEEDCEGKTRQCTCDQCGHKTGKYTWEDPNYCENCGAKMEVKK